MVKTLVVAMVDPFSLDMTDGHSSCRREEFSFNAGRFSTDWDGAGFGADE
jgi:hypothetical protein